MRITNRALPAVLVVLAAVWTIATLSPLVYYALFPNPDIQNLVRALEGRESPPAALNSLVQQANDQLGVLNRAIPVAAYWGASADLNIKKSHTTKTVEVSYLTWFQKLPKPRVFVISRAETDASHLQFEITAGDGYAIVRAYSVPVVLLALSVFWLWKRPSFLEKEPRPTSGDEPVARA